MNHSEFIDFPVSDRLRDHVRDKFGWQPQPVQESFIMRSEDEVLFGGAAGGGKSDALLAYQISRRIKFAGSKGLFLRRTFADLAKGGAAIDRSKDLLYGRAHWDQTRHRWRFPNGSILDFGYLLHEDDKYHYQSSQYDDIAFDELTHFRESQYLYLISRCRATVEGLRPQIRAASNPGGVGHAWVKARFVDSAPPGTPFVLPGDSDLSSSIGHKNPDRGDFRVARSARPVCRPRQGIFIPARLQDNAILMARDPGYWERLMALPEADMRALAYGDWDVFAGQFFREWRRDLHVCAPFELPTTWINRRFSVDWGYGAPWSCHFWVRDEDLWTGQHIQRWYAYRELYATRVRDDDQADLIRTAMDLDDQRQKRLAGFKLRWSGVGDPTMWSKKPGGGTSVADVYLCYPYRVPIHPANNERIIGWQRVRQFLDLNEDEKPSVIYWDVCKAAIRTIPGLVYDQINTEDLDTQAEDHAADELRYFVMSLGPLEPRVESPQRYGFQIMQRPGGLRYGFRSG